MSAEFNDEWASGWEWARMYRDRGLQVVPAHTPHAGQWKRPAVEAWVEFQDALIPESLFARWYDPATGEHRNRNNMGLICGAASRGLVVVDLDVAEGKDGRTWWIGLVAVEANGLEPETVSQVTGGGGRQLLFLAPEWWTPPTFKTPIGVDVRGQGGFIMAPPSMHLSGRIYDFEPGRAPWNCEIAEAPDWLINAITRLREEHGGGPAGGPWERVDPVAAKDAFGHDVDDREHKLAALVWAAVVDLYREAPIPPSQDVQDAEIRRLWDQYEATTRSRLERRPGVTNGELLELEGRGLSELKSKWAYAIGRWDTKVAEAARIPKPEPEPNTWGDRLNAAFGAGDAGMTQPTLDPPDDGSRSADEFAPDPPPRRWLVAHWIAEGEVNSMYGGGATGKSLLALQLACCRAIGTSWLGLETRPGSSLFVSCEDDWNELNRRHAAIKLAMGYAVGSPFALVRLWDRTGLANLLAVPGQGGVLMAAPFLERVRQEVTQHRPELLILDTLADMFGGNEIDRVQVNGFLKTYLGGLIRQLRTDGHLLTVLLLAHPSVAGQQTGTGLSGSTGWENAVRSRLYLSKEEGGSPDVRTLRRAKANYAGGADGALTLIWREGVFHTVAASDELEDAMRVIRNEVRLAWDMKRPFTDRADHPRYLHRALPESLLKAANPFAAEVISQALDELISERIIQKSGNKSRRGWRVGQDD